MKRGGIIIVVGLLGLVALLLTGSSVVASPPRQEPDARGEAITAADVGEAINYQGHLTDSGGNPLDGTYEMQFQFWNAESGGSQVGSTTTVNNVDVDNGLFNAKIRVDQWYFNGQALWLQVRVRPSGGTWDPWMSPRQEILPVPYALSLRPGARIIGEMANSDAIYAENTASNLPSHGVVGKSNSPDGAGGVFINSEGTAIWAGGTGIIESAADTTVWVPGSEAVVRIGTTGLNLLYHGEGIVTLDASSDGTKQIVIPISVPAVLYGQPVRVEQIRYSYKCFGASDSYIDEVKVYRLSDLGNSRAVKTVVTDRDCTGPNWNWVEFALSTANVLSASDGILTLEVTANMKAATGSEIWIGGVRVRLGHDVL